LLGPPKVVSPRQHVFATFFIGDVPCALVSAPLTYEQMEDGCGDELNTLSEIESEFMDTDSY
jgi:hypothetical protein